MGGLYGHMKHLHEDPELTFLEIKKILTKASSGNLIGAEKTDGQNIYLSFSFRTGTVLGARNKTQFRNGGLSIPEMSEHFSSKPEVQKIFVGGMQAFEDKLRDLSSENITDIFGPDGNVFYNVEIMDPEGANVIQYKKKFIIVHNDGHKIFIKGDNAIKDLKSSENVEKLKGVLEQLYSEDDEYEIRVNAFRNLKKLDSDESLKRAVIDISNLQKAAGLTDKDRVADFIVGGLKKHIYETFPKAQDSFRRKFLERLSGNKVNIKELYKLEPDLMQKIQFYDKNSKNTIKSILNPLENIVHEFAFDILSHFKSIFVLDNSQEIERLRSSLEQAIENIKKRGNREEIDILKRNLIKLKPLDNMKTAAEGFTFNHGGKMYKFTGNFAPINQILGILRYKRAKIEEISEDNTKKTQKVALFPGKFKPPHAGHLQTLKNGLNKAEIVKVIISSRAHKGISAKMSETIWKKFLKSENLEGKVELFIDKDWMQGVKSPVEAVYRYIGDHAAPGEEIYLLIEKSDLKDGRYNAAGGMRDDIEVYIAASSHKDKKSSVRATDIRKFVKNDDIRSFARYMPDSFAPEDTVEVFKMLSKDDYEVKIKTLSEIAPELENSPERYEPIYAEETFKFMMNAEDKEIEAFEAILNDGNEKMAIEFLVNWNKRNLEEISSMAAGAIQGFSGKVDQEESEKMKLIREEFINEMKIREWIRTKLKEQKELILESEKTTLNEEQKLRALIRNLIKEAKSPHQNTGINVLEDTLRNILPVIEEDYKNLTSSPGQRESFRSHIINAVKNTLMAVPDDDLPGESEEVEEEIEISMDPEQQKFIDIEDGKPEPKPDPQRNFETLPDEDETGAKFAQKTFDKIETQVIEAYATLSDDTDRSMFFDYMISNLKMYFDKYETDLDPSPPEPESAEYDKSKNPNDIQPVDSINSL